MKNLNGIAAFIQEKGNDLDRLRLRRAVGEPFTVNEAENVLSPYQFKDGSWDYDPPGESERIGSLGGTIHCLRWIREFGLGESRKMTHTLEFLSCIQGSDGSFYETESKLAHSPQRWLQEETLVDRFYFTAAVPMRLISLGYGDHEVVEPAVEWLRNYWVDWDLAAGTWYNLWALICLSRHIEIGSLYSRCHAKALDWLPRLEAQPLTWFLDSLQGAGFSVSESLVGKGIDYLKQLQNEEGLWPDKEYSMIETTITALRVLRDYRIE